MKKDTIREYNAVLDVCRNSPQRKFNIEMELPWIAPKRLGTILTTLANRKLITRTSTAEHSKVYEYLATPNAVYTVLPRSLDIAKQASYERKQRQKHFKSGIVRVGNVTTVSSNAYHSKGSSEKRSVWVGSTANML